MICMHCGKSLDEHQAKVLHCPKLVKGMLKFDKMHTFSPSSK